MFTLLFVIFLILTIVFATLSSKTYDDIWEGLGIGALVITGILGVCVAFNLITVIGGRTLPEKIAMYEEENKKIEEDIAIMVKEYMQYEGDTFKDVTSESAITLVNLYPELKSSELVTQQISIHTENSKKIKELKESLIEAKNGRYLLYFGGN